jgi:hypothetical protein
MDTLFWIGQVGWLAFLACGAYVSFCFWKLSGEERARAAELERRVAQNAKPAKDLPSFILSTLD